MRYRDPRWASGGKNETKEKELKKILLTEIHVEPQEESQNPIQECAHMKNEWQHKSQ